MTPIQTNEPSHRTHGLEWLIGALRRHVLLIAGCAIATAAIAVGVSLAQEKEYTATSSLLFRDPGFTQDLFGGTAELPSSSPDRQAATNVMLVGLNAVSKRTSEALGGTPTPSEVSEKVSVEPAGESDVVTVAATDKDPEQAALVANTFARQFIAFRVDASRSKLVQARNLADREFRRLSPSEQRSQRGESLGRAAEKLGIMASLQTGDAELVQVATVPNSASSPRPMRNGALGFVLGLIVGFGLALALERLNQRIRSPEDAEDAYGAAILTTVPESGAILTESENHGIGDLPFVEVETFKMLLAGLRYFNVDQDIRSVVVTSAMAREGKSTIAWNLARVAAKASKVVLVETDLRRPTIGQRYGLEPGPGLAEILTRQVDLDVAIQSLPRSSKENAQGTDEDDGGSLDIIVAGATPPNPAELIESHSMDSTLSRLLEQYDLVVIDTAPVGVVSDTFPLIRKVDGVIVVTRTGLTLRESARGLREQLDRLDAHLLGIVVNGYKPPKGGRYGYYGYYNSLESYVSQDSTRVG